MFSEKDALNKIVNDLNHQEIGNMIRDLWLEYEDGETDHAKIAHQLDKFEMIVQADEYEQSNPGKILQSFFDSCNGYFTHPEILSWSEELNRKRNERLNINKTI